MIAQYDQLHGRRTTMQLFERRSTACLVVLLISASTLATAKTCPTSVKPKQSAALAEATKTTGCDSGIKKNGFSVPDPKCTPGSINPTVKLSTLKNKNFTTSCVRDKATSAPKKKTTYAAYGITPPQSNTGKTQTCELDHLISIELGGADTLDNIWPQCGPADAELAQRYFKIKDGVENYLNVQVKAGQLTLDEAQKKIASDWTQFVSASQTYWSTHKATGFGKDEP
jgi:hypothetical protein